MSRSALVVRAPNHLGDLIMSLPALAAVPDADVVAPRGLIPLLALTRPEANLIGLDRGVRGMASGAAALRARRYSRGVLLTPSFSSALLFRAGKVRERRGLAGDGRTALLTDAVPRATARGRHRTELYSYLVTGVLPEPRPRPQLPVPAGLRERWRERLPWSEGPIVGVFPGGNAPARRWDPERFREVARRLAGDGVHVVVFGGPAETAMTAAIAGDHALDAGGRTDLPMLAAALAECHILLTNDSGPMHLAAAVGTPTISLWGPGDPCETGVDGAGHRMLRRTELPCVPCVKNECPRRGAGTFLPQAKRECLRLIEVNDVMEAIGRLKSA